MVHPLEVESLREGQVPVFCERTRSRNSVSSFGNAKETDWLEVKGMLVVPSAVNEKRPTLRIHLILDVLTRIVSYPSCIVNEKNRCLVLTCLGLQWLTQNIHQILDEVTRMVFDEFRVVIEKCFVLKPKIHPILVVV